MPFFFKETKSESSMNAASDSDFSDAWLPSHPHMGCVNKSTRKTTDVDKQKM